MTQLTTLQLAKRWKMSEATLRNWRAWGKGPAYVKVGRRGHRWFVFYRLEEIERWERKFRSATTFNHGTGIGIAARLAREGLLRTLRAAR